jgi:CHASE2 domain-containing sensor protein
MLVVIGGAFLINRIVMALKERITFPRTGYIAFKRRTPISRLTRAVVVGIVAAAVTGMMTLFFFNRPMFMSWIPAASGFIFGCVMIFVAWRTEIVRFYGIAALSLIAGVIVSTLGLSNNLGLAIFYGVNGAALLVEGFVVLALYLRANPAPQQEDAHDQ